MHKINFKLQKKLQIKEKSYKYKKKEKIKYKKVPLII